MEIVSHPEQYVILQWDPFKLLLNNSFFLTDNSALHGRKAPLKLIKFPLQEFCLQTR